MAPRKQFLVRIDPDLWAQIEKWGSDELRSTNAQVEWILRDAVRRHGRAAPPATAPAPTAPDEAPGPPDRFDTTPPAR